MSSNTRCSGLSRQRGYSTSRKAAAYSPDLNPIENVWDALGRQVAGRNYPPTNKNTLIRALTEEWDKLPQQLLDNVVQMAAVAEWYGYRTVACFVTGSSPVPLKTRRVGQRCTLNLSRAETSSRWCDVVVRRGGASSGVVHVT
ncbi:uncharacterized protein TNCV_1677431 [Trichonephila clavipes]|nr:uncharacterized protein TNCV_1677431 [Trichonephila clavipes]